MKRKDKRYWYFFTHIECPQCGRLEDIKERRYTKKPRNGMKRHKYEQRWDYCGI